MLRKTTRKKIGLTSQTSFDIVKFIFLWILVSVSVLNSASVSSFPLKFNSAVALGRKKSKNTLTDFRDQKKEFVKSIFSKRPNSRGRSLNMSTMATEKKDEDVMDVFRQMKLDGKPIAPSYSTSSFLTSTLILIALIGFVVPVWLAFFLPFTIILQIGSAIVNRGKISETSLAAHQVLEDAAKDDFTVEKIIPQKDRTYDLILIGSTGFTGKIAVKYLLKQYGSQTNKSMCTLNFTTYFKLLLKSQNYTFIFTHRLIVLFHCHQVKRSNGPLLVDRRISWRR